MPQASKKTKDNLYEIADKVIRDARIKIQKVITDPKELEAVDDILFHLNWQCPKAVIDYFTDVNK